MLVTQGRFFMNVENIDVDVEVFSPNTKNALTDEIAKDAVQNFLAQWVPQVTPQAQHPIVHPMASQAQTPVVHPMLPRALPPVYIQWHPGQSPQLYIQCYPGHNPPLYTSGTQATAPIVHPVI